MASAHRFQCQAALESAHHHKSTRLRIVESMVASHQETVARGAYKSRLKLGTSHGLAERLEAAGGDGATMSVCPKTEGGR